MVSEVLGSGLHGYLLLFVAGFLVTEPWRWAGFYLARRIDVDSEVFKLARIVSTAIVSGLVGRIVVFPAGALADTSSALRIVACLAGCAVFILSGNRLSVGVGAGMLVLVAGMAMGGV